MPSRQPELAPRRNRILIMATNQNNEREFGRMQAEMSNTTDKIIRIEKKLDEHKISSEKRWAEMSAKLDDFGKLVSEVRGGWRVVIFVAGLAGSVVTFFGAKILIALHVF